MTTEQKSTAAENKFAVGTSETGSFVSFQTEAEAVAEAKDWARSEPGVTVLVWVTDEDGGVVDTVHSFCFPEDAPYGSEAHADDYHAKEHSLMDDEERRATGYSQ